MGHKEIEIAGLHACAGERVQGELPIPGGTPIPMTVLCGTQEGATVLITAGIHCAEYVGIQAAMELAAGLDPVTLRGNVVILPLVNRDGFEHRTMSMVHADGKNLNRVFPGSPDGTLSERIAWTITEKIHKRVDFYIDLHGGDGYEEMTPYVYCAGNCAPEVAQRARAMAEQADVPYLVVSNVGSKGSYNHAASMGVPGILIERGGAGRWSQDLVEADKKDVRNILRHLGVLDGEAEPRAHTPVHIGPVIYEHAAHTGCWYPEKHAGDSVRQGEILGVVRDYTGGVLQTCTARQDGVLLYQTVSLNVLEDGPMAAYGGMPQEEMKWN